MVRGRRLGLTRMRKSLTESEKPVLPLRMIDDLRGAVDAGILVDQLGWIVRLIMTIQELRVQFGDPDELRRRVEEMLGSIDVDKRIEGLK